jgi:hypothetical protein
VENDQQLLLIDGGQPKLCRRVRDFGRAEFEGMFDNRGVAPRAH